MENQYDKLYLLEVQNQQKIADIISHQISNQSVVILPTDTIYGLVGDASQETVALRIASIKNRDQKPFVVLMSNKQELLRFSSSPVDRMILDLLPAPVTLIIDYAKDGLAVRIPTADQWIHQVLVRLKEPLIATSVNRSGNPYMNDYNELMVFYDEVDAIVWYPEVKLMTRPSTILDIRSKPYRILRQGDYFIPNSLL